MIQDGSDGDGDNNGGNTLQKKRKIIAGYFSNVYTRVVQRVAPLTHSRIYADGGDSDDDNGGDHELLPSNINHALKGPPQQTLQPALMLS